MNHWLKIALLSSLPVLSHAHTVSPFILPDAFDISSSNVSFQSALTVEKFFVPSNNFKTSYIITQPGGQQRSDPRSGAARREGTVMKNVFLPTGVIPGYRRFAQQQP